MNPRGWILMTLVILCFSIYLSIYLSDSWFCFTTFALKNDDDDSPLLQIIAYYFVCQSTNWLIVSALYIIHPLSLLPLSSHTVVTFSKLLRAAWREWTSFDGFHFPSPTALTLQLWRQGGTFPSPGGRRSVLHLGWDVSLPQSLGGLLQNSQHRRGENGLPQGPSLVPTPAAPPWMQPLS